MKYKYIFMILISLSVSQLISQEISINSIYRHSIKPTQKIITIEFSEEKGQCGTENHLSIDEQIDKFATELKKTSYNFSDFKENKLLINNDNRILKKEFSLSTKVNANIDEIIEICRSMYIKVNPLKYIYSPKNLTDEDEYIKKAIIQTKEIAKAYTKFLNKTKIKVISIDDATSQGSSYYSSWFNPLESGISSKDYSYEIKVKYLLE